MIANMDKQPHISVLMSVFNAEEVISDAIESILDQDDENFEFLIMNDASTDGTPSILETYQTSDSRMKVFHNKENLGLTVSLNKLIHNSKGNIIFRQVNFKGVINGLRIRLSATFDDTLHHRELKKVAYIRHTEYTTLGSWSR